MRAAIVGAGGIARVHARIIHELGGVLVGVCGRSRAGKSTLAHAMVRSLIEDGVASLAVAIQCLDGRADAATAPKSAPYIEAVPGGRRARAAFAGS